MAWGPVTQNSRSQWRNKRRLQLCERNVISARNISREHMIQTSRRLDRHTFRSLLRCHTPTPQTLARMAPSDWPSLTMPFDACLSKLLACHTISIISLAKFGNHTRKRRRISDWLTCQHNFATVRHCANPSRQRLFCAGWVTDTLNTFIL